MSGINYDLKKIKAFVFDVDGVLSPSVVPMSPDGIPQQMANLKDGYAIRTAANHHYPMAIITGNNSEAVKKRFTNLGIEDVYMKAGLKKEILQRWMNERSLLPEEVAYMGDDIPDLDCMQLVGLPAAPADAAPEARAAAKYVSRFNGGYGCARDLIEQTLRAQGNWPTTSVAAWLP